jgi:hypothetical protein
MQAVRPVAELRSKAGSASTTALLLLLSKLSKLGRWQAAHSTSSIAVEVASCMQMVLQPCLLLFIVLVTTAAVLGDAGNELHHAPAATATA